jgi:hypothetical protein
MINGKQILPNDKYEVSEGYNDIHNIISDTGRIEITTIRNRRSFMKYGSINFIQTPDTDNNGMRVIEIH